MADEQKLDEDREILISLDKSDEAGSNTLDIVVLQAMEFFEKAEAIRPPGNDDAILRWNSCARLIMRHHLKPINEEYVEPPLE